MLIALGGAGLAVAVDRPQNSAQRPELSWRGDQEAAPWIEQLSATLEPVDEDISTLSEHAQGVLGSITSLELEKVETALGDGDAAATRVEEAGAALTAQRDEALANLQEWRLGDNSRAAIDALGRAADEVQGAPASWQSVANQARLVVGLIRDLRQHDDLVFQATTAGRESRWGEAVRLLGEADAALASAQTARDDIAANGEVTTLDDLLARYAEYDAALTELYTYVRDTGTLQGPDFDAREQRVEQAQQALPKENSVMTVIAAEAAAEAITNGLVAIEEVRGAILDAQDAVLGPQEPTSEPETEPTHEPDASPLATPVPGHTAEPTLPPA